MFFSKSILPTQNEKWANNYKHKIMCLVNKHKLQQSVLGILLEKSPIYIQKIVMKSFAIDFEH